MRALAAVVGDPPDEDPRLMNAVTCDIDGAELPVGVQTEGPRVFPDGGHPRGLPVRRIARAGGGCTAQGVAI